MKLLLSVNAYDPILESFHFSLKLPLRRRLQRRRITLHKGLSIKYVHKILDFLSPTPCTNRLPISTINFTQPTLLSTLFHDPSLMRTYFMESPFGVRARTLRSVLLPVQCHANCLPCRVRWGGHQWCIWGSDPVDDSWVTPIYIQLF